MMLFLNWTRVAILYEDEYGLIRLQELVRSPPTKNIEIYIRQTNPANYRTVLREIKNKEIFNIIVDTDKEHIQLFFRTLLQLQMNNNKVCKKGCMIQLYVKYISSSTTPSPLLTSRPWTWRTSNTTKSTSQHSGQVNKERSLRDNGPIAPGLWTQTTQWFRKLYRRWKLSVLLDPTFSINPGYK